MDRYLLEGLLRDMRAGRRVLYVARNLSAAQATFDNLVASRLRNDEAYRRVNGDLRIAQADGDGCIYLRGVGGHGYRGLEVDVLVVDDDRELSLNAWTDLRACVAASRVPAESVVRVA